MATCLRLLSSGANAQTQQRAQELWEKMLAAKGISRSPVHTFVLSSKAISGSARYNHGAGRQRQTIVASLPNGWWIFNDFRPGKLGASVEVFDLLGDQAWIAYPHIGNPAQTADPNTPAAIQGREEILAIFFGETTGFAPALVTATRVTRGANTYDVVKARWNDELVYYLDPSTHLPAMLEIVIKGTTTVPAYHDRPAKTISYTDVTPIVMKGYHDVNGIQVPAQVKMWDSWEQDHIDINVNIPADLFRKPPAGVSSAEDWKKATRPASP